LEVEQQEGGDWAERVEERRGSPFEGGFARRAKEQTAAEQTGGGNAVGVKVPVPDERPAASMIFEHGRIQREPHERDAEQRGPDIAQPAMRHAAKQPKQCDSFQSPAERDPFAIELDGKDQAHEKQQRAALPGEPRVARSRLRFFSLEQKQRARGVWDDEGGGGESIAQIWKRFRDDFVEQHELERTRQRA